MHEPVRRVSYLLAALLASTICVVATHASAQDPSLTSAVDLRVPTNEPRYAAIVIDAGSGDILYQERADSPRYPASLTKIMTLYLAFEALSTGRLHEDDLITVSSLAASQAPTKLGLHPGETITVEEAMRAIAVLSANDMAVALAEKIGDGSESRFAAMMTLKARELGMTHTRYVNANGLPDSRQITSARDIATLCMAVLRDYPQYYHYFGTEQFSYRGITVNNHNHLLGHMDGVDGFKTGYTNAAGYNLAASAVRDGHRIIAIELGGSSSAARNANVANLLLTAFDVETRRDHGETFMLTQNMFERTPQDEGGVVQMPQSGEGDAVGGDEDPIDVVLAAAEHGGSVSFQPHASAVTLAAQRPSLVAETPRQAQFASASGASPAAVAAPEPRNWVVHVGEFRTGNQATRQVDRVADAYKSLFDDREGQVAHVGRRYFAIFTGFTEREARAACVQVTSAALPCDARPR